MATREGSAWPVWATVRQARIRANLDVDTLAARAGIARDVIEAIEAAELAPSTDVLFRLVEACGYELRLVIAPPDPQRLEHRAAQAGRTVTQILESNQHAMTSVAALRASTPTSRSAPTSHPTLTPHTYEPPTFATVAQNVERRDGDFDTQFRVVLRLVDEFRYLPRHTQQTILDTSPPTTGDRRWDAFLASLAEWEADAFDLHRPEWAHQVAPLGERWMLNTIESKRAAALHSSPGPFAARNIFLEPDDLHVA